MKPFLTRCMIFCLLVSLLAPQAAVSARPVEIQAALITVTQPRDSGSGSLRAALLMAQAGDIITFDAAVFPPLQPVTILPTSPLPVINQDQITIDASQAGVILDGSLIASVAQGLELAGNDCTIMGLTIQNFRGNGILILSDANNNTIGGDRLDGAGPNGQGNRILLNGGNGVEIQQAQDNRVLGNWIGVDATGQWEFGNGYNGIAILDGSHHNTIGGATANYRNVISGNTHSGIWIAKTGSDNNLVSGNYIGVTADGEKPLGNHMSGIAIHEGAASNTIGGETPGTGNLISGNWDNGVTIADPDVTANAVFGNLIGVNWNGQKVIGQGNHGVLIANGAYQNIIGSPVTGGGNVISGNRHNGVFIKDNGTRGNKVQGNIIGANGSGSYALGNGNHGVEIAQQASENLVGGNRTLGEGNLLSGNLNHGFVIYSGAHDNLATGNLIGPDKTGQYGLGNQPMGGVDIDDANDNTIGGLSAGQENIISGNPTDGIAIFNSHNRETRGNKVLGNWIGLTADGVTPLPNLGTGVFNVNGAFDSLIRGNRIAYNQGAGVLVSECGSNRVTQNSIYANEEGGVENRCSTPVSLQVSAITSDTLAVTTEPNATVEFYSDDGNQGRTYLGSASAASDGNFQYKLPGKLEVPQVTAIATTPQGQSSAFSPPVRLGWTVMLYLNGDNDLDEAMVETLEYLAQQEPIPYANVLVLIDGYTTILTGTYASPTTRLYDLNSRPLSPLPASLGAGPTFEVPGELNMGDGQVLAAFVEWARENYPAKYSLLSIVDHGGGWAPSIDQELPGILRKTPRFWMAGGSGLSWDFSSDHDYFNLVEVQEALSQATGAGTESLDILFFDVCLMGMIEVAHQVQPYANYYLSAQNLGWTPVGADGRYVKLLHSIAAGTTPAQLAEAMVNQYAASMPPSGHPFSISAVDLSKLPAITSEVQALGQALGTEMENSQTVQPMRQAYLAAQKIDYDGDFAIEPETDGFVDLYSFAQQVEQKYASKASIVQRAQNLITLLDEAVVAEEHRSGAPWHMPDQAWNLDGLHGLSIFLPLGEDLTLPFTVTSTITPSLVITHNIPLRELYNANQLGFVADTQWDDLVSMYYTVTSTGVPVDLSDGPMPGLLTPDVTPPQTTITLSVLANQALHPGETINITWISTDTQTSVSQAVLWYRLGKGEWQATSLTQKGQQGIFTFTLPAGCPLTLAVRATDKAGNLEAVGDTNSASLKVGTCTYVPMLELQK